jgi:hypothetical protein
MTRNSIALSTKLRMAGLQAATVDAYAESLDLVVTDDDRATLAAVVRHFEPRFESWWRREATPHGTPFAHRIETLMSDPRVSAQLSAFARFYEASLSASDTLHFTLLYRPTLVPERQHGEQAGRYALVEFTSDEQPEDRMDVVVHKLCHYLIRRAPAPHARELYNTFLTSRDTNAIAAYNLLDETLATAFGNGMIARALRPSASFATLLGTPRSLYYDETIDRSAKALLPWLDEWLASRRTLYDPAFVPEYLAHLHQEFGTSLRAPRLLLNRMVLFTDSTFGGSVSRIAGHTFLVSAHFDSESPAEYRRRPHMPALVVVRPEHLTTLISEHILTPHDATRIKAHADSTGGALFTSERSPGVYTFTIVARDTSAVREQVERLARQPEPLLGLAPAAAMH